MMQVFPREFKPDKWYVYFAYIDGEDGWYVGPFNSPEEVELYDPEDPEACLIRVFQGEDPE